MKKHELVLNRFSEKAQVDHALGFSLLEVLLSIILLVTLAVGIGGAGILMKRTSGYNDDRVVALQAMEKEMVKFKAMTTGVLRDIPDGVYSSKPAVGQLKKANGAESVVETYFTQLEKDNNPDPLLRKDSGLRELDMRVLWTDNTGRDRAEYLTNVIYVE